MTGTVAVVWAQPAPAKFNQQATLPYQRRLADFGLGLQGMYDLLFDLKGDQSRTRLLCYPVPPVASDRGCGAH